MKKPHLMLLSLVAGLAVGLAARLAGWAPLLSVIDAIAPVGTLWVKGLQMTLIPLIFAMVASAVAASVRSGSGGRMIGGVLVSFIPLLAVAVLLTGLTAFAICQVWPVPPNALAGLVMTQAPPPVVPGLAEQVMALIPKNPVAAAANGEITPMVVFAILLGFALTRLPRRENGGLEAGLHDLAAAMMVVVDWVLWCAPVGIFVLAMGAARSAGGAMASLLAHYVVIQIAASLVLMLAAYGLAVLAGGVSLGRFARGILAPQTVAAGTCSSMATLPAMLEAATQNLGLPERVAGSVLPLAVSSFRTASAGSGFVALYVGALAAGTHPSLAQFIIAGLVCVLASLGAAGVPGAAVIYASDAPGMQIVGAPIELIPLMIAVIAIPDIFLTMANVTSDLSLVTVVARFVGVAPATADLEPAAEAA
jgi:proton glutamate symport protein